MIAIITIALLAFLSGEPASDADTFMLKLYDIQQGDVREITKNENIKRTIVSMANDKGGKKVEVLGLQYSYKEEILEKNKKEKRAAKGRRTYSKAREIKDGKETMLAYEGKEVLIEKKGDAYEFSVDGKALDKDDADFLDREWNKKESGGADRGPATEKSGKDQ